MYVLIIGYEVVIIIIAFDYKFFIFIGLCFFLGEVLFIYFF